MATHAIHHFDLYLFWCAFSVEWHGFLVVLVQETADVNSSLVVYRLLLLFLYFDVHIIPMFTILKVKNFTHAECFIISNLHIILVTVIKFQGLQSLD